MAEWGHEGLSDPRRILDASDDCLMRLLRPTGYHTSKPKRLRNLAEFVVKQGGAEALVNSRASVSELRSQLLGLWGIGPETADAILLYALDRSVFVADAYALRLCARWGLLPPAAKYEEVQALFMQHLPMEVKLYNEYHALIVAHAKQICRPKALCEICPLNRPPAACEAVTWRCPRLYAGRKVGL
jgi:endonuclease-3 related protein